MNLIKKDAMLIKVHYPAIKSIKIISSYPPIVNRTLCNQTSTNLLFLPVRKECTQSNVPRHIFIGQVIKKTPIWASKLTLKCVLEKE